MSKSDSPRFSFPITLDVVGRRCVVVGGGPLANEKAEALRDAGALVEEVPAEAFHLDLLDDAFLLIVSGEDSTDPETTFAEAERRGVLANFLDDIPHCNFAFPSIVERGALKVAVSTAGKAPALARQVRRGLEDQLPDELGALVDAYASARAAALPRTEPFDLWASAWRTALDDIEGLLALCRHGETESARDRILATVFACLGRSPQSSGDQRSRDKGESQQIGSHSAAVSR